MSSPVPMKFPARRIMLAALAALGVVHSARAQPLYCTAIRPGETAVQVAQRITGDAGSTRESWFQIVNPATSRFVPKSSYVYVRAGWRACVTTALGDAVAPPITSHGASWVQPLRAAYDDIVRLFQSPDSDLGLWIVLLALIALATHSADHYFRDREELLKAMHQFSQKFIREFERPLVGGDQSGRPIQSRLRFAPHSSRLDILIAPGAGHRYPNLMDHRNNVEYDVKRVLNVLGDEPFINGRPYTDGQWVVLPFQVKPGITEAGGT